MVYPPKPRTGIQVPPQKSGSFVVGIVTIGLCIACSPGDGEAACSPGELDPVHSEGISGACPTNVVSHEGCGFKQAALNPLNRSNPLNSTNSRKSKFFRDIFNRKMLVGARNKSWIPSKTMPIGPAWRMLIKCMACKQIAEASI